MTTNAKSTRVAPTAASMATLFPTQRTTRKTLVGSPLSALAGSNITRWLLGPRSFVWWWLAMLAVHVLNALATLAIARLYFYLADPRVSHKFNPLQVPVASLQRSGYSFAAIAVAHGVAIMRILFYSFRHKELSFGAESSIPAASPRASNVSNSYPRRFDQITALARANWCHVCRPWNMLFGRNGYFGLNGALFDVGFEVREATEIAMQTYQAYNLSKSVSKRWINALAVATIVTNCCTTPLAYALVRGESKTLTRRIICRLMDAALDMCCSLVVPFAIVLPYLSDYDHALNRFRAELYYDDIWYVDAIATARYVLITSVADYIATLAPHVGVFTCLLAIESLLQRAPQRRRTTRRIATHDATKLGVANDITSQPQPTIPSSDVAIKPSHRCRCRPRIIVHALFLLCGAAVACLHLFAEYNGSTARLGCKLHVNAWFTRQYPCSVMEVNCYRQQITGSADEISSVLLDLDRFALRTIIITHCPALHMPAAIQAFPLLGALEVYNCSLESWSREAAIRQTHNPKISYVLVICSNLSHIPDGLLHSDLPVDFTQLGFIRTNLSVIPDDIDTYWGDKGWINIGFEGCGLTSVPAALGRLAVYGLVLQANALTSVPASLFDGNIYALDVSFNPQLAALPSTITSPHAIDIQAAGTALTAIPNWLRDWTIETPDAFADTTLFDTPFCHAFQDDDAAAASPASRTIQDVDSTVAAAATVLCGANSTTGYPIAILLPQRQP